MASWGACRPAAFAKSHIKVTLSQGGASPAGAGEGLAEGGRVCMSGQCQPRQCHEPPTGTRAGRRGQPQQDRAAGDSQPDTESVIARRLRARGVVAGHSTAQTASVIKDECGPEFGTTWIRAYRLALGITLADVVEQVRAWYEAQ